MTNTPTRTTADETRSNPSVSRLLWLFPPVLLIHFAEEFGGVTRSINLSRAQFLALGGFGLASMVVLIALSVRLGFSRFVQVCLGTLFVVNGLSHAVNTAAFGAYNAGVISGVLVFIPLGLLSLFGLKGGMSRARYLVALALGLVMQAAATLLSH